VVTLSTLTAIAKTGQPRKPSTPGEVVIITLANTAIIVITVLAALKIGV
jgi:acyl-coenzyme A synthetase/AMP-(fatty) acid ligase